MFPLCGRAGRSVLQPLRIGLRSLTDLLNRFDVGRTVFLCHGFSVPQKTERVCRPSDRIPRFWKLSDLRTRVTKEATRWPIYRPLDIYQYLMISSDA